MSYGSIVAPAAGAPLATDLIGGVNLPRSKLTFGPEGTASDVSADSPLPVSVSSLPLASGAATDARLAAIVQALSATLAVSAASLPLPQGAATDATLASILAKLIANPATSDKQDANTAAIATIGTRSYGEGQRITVSSSDAATSGLAATEVLLHASIKCYVRAGHAAQNTDIPLEAGEKFTMRIDAGSQVHVIRDSADGYLNVVPVI